MPSGWFLYSQEPPLGTLEIEAGVFDPGRYFEPGANSQVVLTVAGTEPGAGHAQVAFPDEAKLGGSLLVKLAEGFAPGTNTFALATYKSRTGEFASPALPSLPPGSSWKVNYGVNQLELSVVESTAANLGSASNDNGVFRLSLSGPAGRYALFQVTTNLVDWTTIQTNEPFAGAFQFEDSSATNASKFYRTVIVQ